MRAVEASVLHTFPLYCPEPQGWLMYRMGWVELPSDYKECIDFKVLTFIEETCLQLLLWNK